jgi:hypothetical protein
LSLDEGGEEEFNFDDAAFAGLVDEPGAQFIDSVGGLDVVVRLGVLVLDLFELVDLVVDLLVAGAVSLFLGRGMRGVLQRDGVRVCLE